MIEEILCVARRQIRSKVQNLPIRAILSSPTISIQRAIVYRLRYMHRLDIIGSRQIGNCSSHLDYAIVGSRRKVQSTHCTLQQGSYLATERAEATQHCRVHHRIGVNGCTLKASQLYLTRCNYALTNLGTRLLDLLAIYLRQRHRNNLDMHIYTIQKWSRDAREIAIYGKWLTRTLLGRVVVKSARTRVHCANQSEV